MARTGSVTDYSSRVIKGPSSTYGATNEFRHPQTRRSIRWTIGRVSTDVIGDNGKNYIEFWVNPNECQWRAAVRTTTEKINGGCVHHEWPQTGMYGSNESYRTSRLDQPTLSISFQSGIITPGGYNDIMSGEESDETNPPPGLGNFYDFLNLLDRPDVLASGEPNYINIIYASPIFGGRGIWLQGFFTEDGVAWTDLADNPNMISAWGATFMVFTSQPSLSMLLKNFELLNIPT